MAVTAPKFEDIHSTYDEEWKMLTVRGDRLAEVTSTAREIAAEKATFLAVEKATGVPWYFVGLICYRESTLDLTKWLGNGDPLNEVSRHAPPGHGPWKSWQDGAVEALTLMGYVGATDWSIARMAYRWERYNGFGPRVKHGIKPSYLYGGSTLYEKGKYVKDGPEGWDPNHEDRQLGVMVVLKVLLQTEGLNTAPPPAPAPGVVDPDDELAHGVLWAQWALNRLAGKQVLEEDGVAGDETVKAVRLFQTENHLTVDGELGDETFDEIERHLAKVAPVPHPVVPPAAPGKPAPPPPVARPYVGGPLREAFRRLFGR